MWIDKAGRSPEEALELLSGLTARLASTARLDDIVDTVLDEIVELGFGAVWMAVLDESTQNLVTLKEVIDGVDTTHEMPKIFALDMRQPVGHGFRERRMINITDPDALHIIERDQDEVPPGRLALPRVIYEHMRGHPFACGPLMGSRGQPVGALGLSSYLGHEPIPDELFSHGLLRAFMAHLGIAMERARNVARLERLNSELVAAQTAIARDARIKAVGELAAAVAHDLNNLSGVALLAANVGMRSPAAALDALPRIVRANRAIGELVSRLQRVARQGATDGEVHDRARLHEIVDDIVVMVSPVMRECSITLDLDIEETPEVRCDPAVVHRLVLNLLLNAHDALAAVPPEHRRIRIRLRDDGGMVRLFVSDTGPGIAPNVLAHLFEPFVTTKAEHHAGLGLAAARASLEHFGGTIEGRNAPSGGAVFEVTFAVAGQPGEGANERAPEVARARPQVDPVPVTPPGPADPPPAPGAPRAATAPIEGTRILAIDDDPDIVDIIREYLEPLGYEVVTRTAADDGLSMATAELFDLVLCDVGMPQRSGLDVCQSLRQTGFRGKLVLMTGWDAKAVEADRRAATCDGVIKKPFLGADLRHVITSLLGS